MPRKSPPPSLLTLGVLAFASHPAIAQEAPEAGTGAGALEEIVVTAQKREESLQETPIAITAFTSTQLRVQRVNNVMDLVNKVPSLNLAPFAGTRVAPNLFIRGMGNLNSQTTKDGATGIYIDGVPVGRSIGLATDIADLERIEVLRGPQGTLWGRNTTAGAINFITEKPSDELAFTGQITGGSWDLFSGRVMVNAPVTDEFFVRAAYMYTENDGWVENRNTTLSNQINFNEDRRKAAVRFAARYQPTESFTADYAFDNSDMTYGNHFYQVIQGPRAVRGRQESAVPLRGLRPSDTEVGGHTLTLDWDLGAMTVRSISAYRDLESRTNMNFIDIFTQDNIQDQDQFSQELQLVGDALGERLRYATGLFYFQEDSNENLASRFAGGALVDQWEVEAESTSAAIYGQATWTPPVLDDRLDLTVGLRYTEDTRKATKTYTNPGFTPAIRGLVVVGDRDFDSLNPAATVDYAFTDHINSYVKFSTGYRAGGFNTQSTPTFFGQGFDEENVDAWEVGLKSEFFAERLRVNLAAFSNDYEDLQVDQARVPPIFTDTINAGSAEIEGIELEASAVLAEGLTLDMFASWLDGQYNSYIDNGVDLADQKHIQNAPDWHYGAGVDYAFPSMAIGDLALHVDYRRQDEFYAGPNANTLSPGYEIWNARLELANIDTEGRGTFRIAVWGRNLGDEIYRYSTTNLGAISAQFGPPRSMGVDAIYEF